MSHDPKSQLNQSSPSNRHLEHSHESTAAVSSSDQSHRPRLDPDTLYPTFDAFKTIARNYAAYYNFEPRLSARDQQRVLFRCKGRCDSITSSNEKKTYQKPRPSPYPTDHATKPHCIFSVGVRRYKKKGDMVAMIVKNAELRHSCGVRGELEMDADSGDIGAARILWRAQSGASGEATPTDAMSSSAGGRSQAHSMERGTGSDGMFSSSLVDEVMMELVRGGETSTTTTTAGDASEIGTRQQQHAPRAPFPPNSQNFQREPRPRRRTQNYPTTERGTSPMSREFHINPSHSHQTLPSGHVIIPSTNDPLLEPQLREAKARVNQIMYQISDLIANGFPTSDWQLIDLEIQMAREADNLLQRLLAQIWEYYLAERNPILPSQPPYFTANNAIDPPLFVALTVDEKVKKVKAMRNVVVRGWNELARRAEVIVKDWQNMNWADAAGLNPEARKAYLQQREEAWRMTFSELEECTSKLMKLLNTVKGFGQMNTIRGIQRARSVG